MLLTNSRTNVCLYQYSYQLIEQPTYTVHVRVTLSPLHYTRSPNLFLDGREFEFQLKSCSQREYILDLRRKKTYRQISGKYLLVQYYLIDTRTLYTILFTSTQPFSDIIPLIVFYCLNTISNIVNQMESNCGAFTLSVSTLRTAVPWSLALNVCQPAT